MTDDHEIDEGRMDAYFERITDLIKEHGHALQGVFGDEDGPSFTYTVGMSGMDHPEFIIIGLPYNIAGTLLNDLGDRVHQGQTFHAGQIIDDLIRDYPALLIAVTDTTVHLTVANRLYGITEPITALQVVFPDPKHLWPWQDGSTMAGMELLGPVPDDYPGKG